MILLVFRHGIAQEQSKDGADDSRTLSTVGERKTEEAARGLAELTDRPDVILTSPKTRAAQTAEILGRVFHRKPKMLDVLGHGDAGAIIRALARQRRRTVLIVGHEPVLSELIAHLCFGKPPLRTHGGDVSGIQLKKAGCAALRCPDRRRLVAGCELLWLTTPRLLRRLGR